MKCIVTLPRALKPVFPDKCVRCKTNTTGKTCFFHFNGLRLFSTQVPACKSCKIRIVSWLIWDNLRTLLIAGAAFAFGMVVLLPVLPGWATGLIVLLLCCIGFLVVFLWNLKHPPIFNIDAGPWQVDYEFSSKELAKEFALLNGATGNGENEEG